MNAVDPLYVMSVTVAVLLLVIVCSITDIQSRRIPNEFLAAGLALAFMCNGFAGGFAGILFTLSGLALGLAMLLPFYILGGTGAGDVKLLGVVGALLGPHGAFVAGIATLICGGLLGIAWLSWRMVDSWFAGQNARYSELKSAGIHFLHLSVPVVRARDTSLPYAPAIAAGSAIALWTTGISMPAAA